MPALPPRRLKLVDGMILVAGVALGLVLTRQYLRDSYPDFALRVGDLPDRLTTVTWWIGEASRVALMWLATLAPALLAIRLLRPRPPLARVFRQPGAIAALAGTVLLVVGALIWATVVALEDQRFLAAFGPGGIRVGFTFYELTFARTLAQVGPAVAVAWLALALARRLRPERGWVDRAGCLLGVGFLLVSLGITWQEVHQGIASARSMVHNQPILDRLDAAFAQEEEAQEEHNRRFEADLLRIRREQQVKRQQQREVVRGLLDIEAPPPIKDYLRDRLATLDGEVRENDAEIKEMEAKAPPAASGPAGSRPPAPSVAEARPGP